MKKFPIIIDTDPGIDDALAILLAFQCKKLDIKLITTVAGNVGIETATKNTLFLVKKYGYEIPVVKGANTPLVREPINASDVHGNSGLGNFKKDNTSANLSGEDAPKAISAILKSSLEPIIIIALGPLTNIAKLIQNHHDCLYNIKRMYLMTGSFDGKGNIVKHAEFNAFADPEALDIVLKSGLDIVLSPMELGQDSAISKKVFEEMEITSEKDMMVTEMIEGGHDTVVKGKFGLHDPNTILALIKPSLYRFRKCNVFFSTDKKAYGKMKIQINSKGRLTVQIIRNIEHTKKYFLKQIYKD